MKTFAALFFAMYTLTLVAAETPSGAVLYESNFEKAEPEKLPDEFMVLEGGFIVKQEGTNKFLELPGAPLDTFGLLFGPTETENVSVSGRIFGTGKGRRFPTFAVGLSGAGGYKLQVSPGKKEIELIKGDAEVLAHAPYKWESRSWTLLKLQLRKLSDAEWILEGKVWKEGALEPQRWTISHKEKTVPVPGRAAVWGMPYAGTPIQFDDLKVTRVTAP